MLLEIVRIREPPEQVVGERWHPGHPRGGEGDGRDSSFHDCQDSLYVLLGIFRSLVAKAWQLRKSSFQQIVQDRVGLERRQRKKEKRIVNQDGFSFFISFTSTALSDPNQPGSPTRERGHQRDN